MKDIFRDSLSGIEIRVDTSLVGSKKAVRLGDGPIYVTPAMMDLVQHAEGDELRRLLGSIPLVTIPDYSPDYSSDYRMGLSDVG